MMFPRTKARRQFGVIAGTLATALTLAACGGGSTAGGGTSGGGTTEKPIVG